MDFLNKLKWYPLILLGAFFINSCGSDDDPVNNNDFNFESELEEFDDFDGFNDFEDFNEGENEPSGNISGQGILGTFRLDGDNFVQIDNPQGSQNLVVSQNAMPRQQRILDLIKDIVPINYRSRIGRYIIFAGGSAGYATPTTSDLSVWDMAIAVDQEDENEIIHTIVHELFHILTLDNTQLNPLINEQTCENFFTGEGCANETSYINELVSNHWEDILDSNNTEQESNTIFNMFSDRFVTSYAATNPGEDIAEVGAFFVLTAEGFTTKEIAREKIQILRNRTELVELRNSIRTNLNLDANTNSINALNAVMTSNKLTCGHLHKK